MLGILRKKQEGSGALEVVNYDREPLGSKNNPYSGENWSAEASDGKYCHCDFCGRNLVYRRATHPQQLFQNLEGPNKKPRLRCDMCMHYKVQIGPDDIKADPKNKRAD